MIHITIFKNKKFIHSVEIKGHAESGPYGYDLVCAGVSAVSFGAINAAIKLSGITLKIDQHGEGGYLYVEIPENATSQQRNIIEHTLQVMLISLQTIEREYSQFVQIKEVRT